MPNIASGALYGIEKMALLRSHLVFIRFTIIVRTKKRSLVGRFLSIFKVSG
jgi:hypothetical protein